LHRVTAKRFGWHRDNTIGANPQHNAWMADWVEFFAPPAPLPARSRRALRSGGSGSSKVDACDRLGVFFAGSRRGRRCCMAISGRTAKADVAAPVIFDRDVLRRSRGRSRDDAAACGFGREFHAAYQSAWLLDRGAPVRRDL
jgi:hypothetical protein